MDIKTAASIPLIFSNPILSTAASTVGISKTGTAIGSLHGICQYNATAAWVGLGSMQVGSIVMGALPLVGVALFLNRLAGPDHGSPILDPYEEAWKDYEVKWELEELKKTVKVDPSYKDRVRCKMTSFAQDEYQFKCLEIEQELYQLKQEMDLVD